MTRTASPPLWLRVRIVVGALLLLLVAAIATTTKVVDLETARASDGARAFNAADYARQKYDSVVVPAVEKDAVKLDSLLAAIVQDPAAAGDRYGHRAGPTSPYSYAASGVGIAGPVAGSLLPVEIAGLPAGVKVVLQIGPAINGTALRDATGLISFDQFLNQLEYANASTELNNKVKANVLATVNAAALAGKRVSFVGAFTYGSNPKLIQVTPVRLEVTP